MQEIGHYENNASVAPQISEFAERDRIEEMEERAETLEDDFAASKGRALVAAFAVPSLDTGRNNDA